MTAATLAFAALALVAQPLAAHSAAAAHALSGTRSQADCDASAATRQLFAPPPGAAFAHAHAHARAYWLDRRHLQWPRVAPTGIFRLHYSMHGQIRLEGGQVRGADGELTLQPSSSLQPSGPLRPGSAGPRFGYLPNGPVLEMPLESIARLPALLRAQLLLTRESAGRVLDATALQSAGVLDDLYAAAAAAPNLGVRIEASGTPARTGFRLWAPTAQAVSLCIYASGTARASTRVAMQLDAATGIWGAARPADLSGQYYLYLVDVFVRGSGVVRNRVTDPYSVSLTTNSRRSYIASLDAARLKPAGWDTTPTPARVAAASDMVIYELHVRDFSAGDRSVPAAHRGKYLAFTDSDSNGMRHLRALAAAGVTDLHLMPVFDFATTPEQGCVTPVLHAGAADDPRPQAQIAAGAARDCYNWGYDPWHYSAPEGSYASDAADGARRIVEFRQMVQALHRAGLRVGMDVVYNHTMAAGQDAQSVLDRIVPGYYHRLDANGAVERSTCCANTATENTMMARLMLDSVEQWAREYHIDSFRFDLMGHQPRAVMEQLQRRLDAGGRHVQLIGEGWNFGEVADGARFVQASQLSLYGSGIGTFSDRARDAIRGGGPSDHGVELVTRQGYVTGCADAMSSAELLAAADMVRVGLAGSLRDYALPTWRDVTLPLQAIDYHGQPAGYAAEPGEVVNYVENHDNHTLFDIGVFRLPRGSSHEDRARTQILAAALNAFSQGIAYFHAGVETLRSKSLDRNSFESGDWFNQLDWTFTRSNFGVGLPPQRDNGADWAVIRPLLADATIRPGAAQIAWTRDAFLDLLRIRASSTLFRLRTADDVRERLRFHNTGSAQRPALIVGDLDGTGYPGAGFSEIVYLVNVDREPQDVTIAALAGRALRLHPVHTATGAADERARAALYDATTGRFHVPARTAVVFVAP